MSLLEFVFFPWYCESQNGGSEKKDSGTLVRYPHVEGPETMRQRARLN